jgi:predicted P-loop ATPase/GTPase
MFSDNSRYSHKIEYSLCSDEKKETRTGYSFNVNNPWLCLYTSDDLLRVGQELNLYNGAPEYSQKAIVRWIEKLDDYYFVILDYVKQNNAIEYPYNPESVNNL